MIFPPFRSLSSSTRWKKERAVQRAQVNVQIYYRNNEKDNNNSNNTSYIFDDDDDVDEHDDDDHGDNNNSNNSNKNEQLQYEKVISRYYVIYVEQQ